jgi:signal transduction histidine kinase
MVSGISLANKCQLLFGFAVVVILAAALSVPWNRTRGLIKEYQVEVARQLADAWVAGWIRPGSELPPPESIEILGEGGDGETGDPLLRVRLVEVGVDGEAASRDAFLRDALAAFRADPAQREFFQVERDEDEPVYRYARAVRRDSGPAGGGPPVPLEAVLLIDRASQFAEGQLLRSRIYIIAAALVASLLAVLAFYLILTRLILRPVRTLRETAERVEEGDLAIRSEIRTGDEFEQLSEAFNEMLARVGQSQAQLRAMNEMLDLKVNELAEANVGLFESNRFKNEFLANVSHELRTPLNSIIGFAELLEEIARNDDSPVPKRVRYLNNILTSGRALLEMINELLDMAKIEAGRMEVNIEPTSVTDLIEGLVGAMRPQALAKDITLQAQLGANVPVIETDPGKLQQILYNFLSNAIKFTPHEGTVTITADRLTRQDNSLGVRLAVSDSGPGIPEDMQDVIFEKFRQIDSSHTREHPGTGLGLAICKELAEMLGATVSFVSKPGHGATFYVDLPMTHQPDEPQPLMA